MRADRDDAGSGSYCARVKRDCLSLGGIDSIQTLKHVGQDAFRPLANTVGIDPSADSAHLALTEPLTWRITITINLVHWRAASYNAIGTQGASSAGFVVKSQKNACFSQ